MDNRLYLWMVLAMLFWGASWPIANILSGYLTMHEFIAYRYILTTLSMAPVLWWMKLSFKIDWSNLVVASLAAFMLIFYTKFYYLSAKHGAPGLAGAVVTTLMPILVYLLMLFGKQKHPVLKDWLALVLGSAGVATTMNIWHFKLDEILVLQNMYLVAAAGCWAVASLIIAYVKTINPAVLSFYIYLLISIFEMVFFLKPSSDSIFMMDDIFWINFLILTIGSTTFATTVYFLGIQSLGAKRASVFTFLVPFFAIGLSVIFLSEQWQWTTVAGAVMTIVALIILNRIHIYTKISRVN
ncbi:hypothetical protein [uncultured Gammaproteobacteria bacterium]|uniref:DMT family transporter n=1 Tax=Bathymodiolus heckerae thiotrophic gill symbiont TaxID=1052212 RepID=UPI0010B980FF|nr:DMT family transporter [Bathymodiolus heckerae thiotrophic gill symbiont]CAC9433702.1 hypothetical protein [uncultured Gammaproteobacteria bacterium]SMN13664.1 PUTATIVE INTEGRAL MEMBRANE PROTEIN [Bathymodiolus heckerae thiotrophic gill symbiont]SMN15229.1 PUTATIVE INTEGRAL MEMBRANE PROTEIN [uncultured Candidatus Thioglobus sp.]